MREVRRGSERGWDWKGEVREVRRRSEIGWKGK